MNTIVPVHILSGFLGSGKTTFLTQALDYYRLSGKKPAVLMNELGDVNLDGMLVDDEVPMTEMLSGCICCTIRGDLGMELRELILEHKPDVIFVECTGAANPIEILDGVTDASLLTEMELKSLITIVDAAQLLERHKKGQGKTYRLMQDQIRCASELILNKTDLVSAADLLMLEHTIREWNQVAPMTATVKCQIDLTMLDRLDEATGALAEQPAMEHAHAHDHKHDDHDHEGAACTHPSHNEHAHAEEDQHHHSHDHVMVYTHYFANPVNSEQFEELVSKLPAEIYRAKGILQFTDTSSLFLFQFAYREMDFVKITPKEQVPNVAVFIGEHFSKSKLAADLIALEQAVSVES
ncbi:CobW family GTP-binding protein [Paenibacillus agricola]|uniref:GTP-binding protein n=1 Tax=Paenibacillus agricola TaxID=2716264 RepID=A0ABX0J5E2_9BACL|nr:GTP-binding protein [Paenibacillus agricola]NHN30631.1 GTP-binding protein [Paenibacillus agricola]